MHYRADIDGLRAVAILSVVLFHALPAKLPGGFIGVDIFFVISGFLISSIILKRLERGDFSFSQFYGNRARRIFPALILMVTATYTFGWFALLPDEFAQLGKHMVASALFVQNISLYYEAGYFDVASDLKPLMHLWSLAIEEQFYMLYPLILWAAWRAGLNVLMLLVVLALASFCLNIVGIGHNPTQTFFFPQTRFWELLAGALLGYVQLFKRAQVAAVLHRCLLHPRLFPVPADEARQQALVNNVVATVGAGLLAIGLITIDKNSLFPGWFAVLPVGGACLLILAGPDSWLNRRVLASRLMVFVGLISYPLYLWHWPVLAYARILETGEANRWVILGAVVLSFVLAWLTYRLLETPLRLSKRTWAKTIGASALLVVVGVVGITTLKDGGVESRPGMQELAKENPGIKIEDFAWDTSVFNYGECVERLTDEAPKIGYCSVSKPGKEPTIALIGDSHADAIFPGVAKNDDKSWLLIGNAGCPPVTDVNVRADNGDCENVMEKAVNEVANTKSIDTVVLTFFANYVMDTRYAPTREGKKNTANDITITSKDTTATSKPDLFYFGLERTVSQLEAAGKKVLITIDTPELPFQPRDCINRPFAEKNLDCEVARSEVDSRQKVHRELLEKLVEAHPKTKLFDPINMVCNGEVCKPMGNDLAFYRDAHHMSMRGSDLYAKNFLPWVKANQRVALAEKGPM